MSSNRSDRVYKDLKVFIEGFDGKKRPLVIGYSYEDGDKTRFQITCLPPPWAKTDGSGVIEGREDRGQRANGGGVQRGQQQSSSGGYGSEDDPSIPF
jgi:hypothetical protein